MSIPVIKPRVYIFDLDDTLYQNPINSTNRINRGLFELLDGIKIIFTNSTYAYCLVWLGMLDIKDLVTVIISRDVVGCIKPHPAAYIRLMDICHIHPSSHDIYFFDNLLCNLVPAQALGWHPILIMPVTENVLIESRMLFGDSMEHHNCINDAVTKKL